MGGFIIGLFSLQVFNTEISKEVSKDTGIINFLDFIYMNDLRANDYTLIGIENFRYNNRVIILVFRF